MHLSRNRLRLEKSEFLQQRERDLVHWFSFGEPALEAAVNLAKPVFLLLGSAESLFSARMASECFCDPAVADLMNSQFINVAICAKERPHFYEYYLAVARSMAGIEGMPLSVFLTPQLAPFFSTTVFDRSVNSDFYEVLKRISDLFEREKLGLSNQSGNITELLTKRFDQFSLISTKQIFGIKDTEPKSFCETLLSKLRPLETKARAELIGEFDLQYYGFLSPGKEIWVPRLEAMLKLSSEKKISDHLQGTLQTMASSSLFDHIGYGFFSKCLGKRWDSPLVEKVLDNNAALLSVFARASVLFSRDDFEEVSLRLYEFIRESYFDESRQLYCSGFSSDSDTDAALCYGLDKQQVRETFCFDSALERFAALFFSFSQKEFLDVDFVQTPAVPIDFRLFCKTSGYSEVEGLRLRSKVFEILRDRRSKLVKPKVLTTIDLGSNASLARALIVSGLSLSQQKVFEEGLRLTNRLLARFVSGKNVCRLWYKPSEQPELNSSANAHDAAELLSCLTFALLATNQSSYVKAIAFVLDWILRELVDETGQAILFLAKKSRCTENSPISKSFVVAEETKHLSIYSRFFESVLHLKQVGFQNNSKFSKIFEEKWSADLEKVESLALGTVAPLARIAPGMCPFLFAFFADSKKLFQLQLENSSFEEKCESYRSSL